ncbi:MAG: tRNA preQ1(34) S-adenosylmethionine ribosyltransferase-isomerase QueA [Erysipelotrichaceae bacterium]|nr:tRNA preQ1(34) S-adenosylmethionine ribosyltransferase-isomerase QueA [Erysipelotrichaceae bacterium]
MDKREFMFDLPHELIAQIPLKDRSASRMMVVDKTNEKIFDRQFIDIIDLLNENDVLVRNNSRVIPARLYGVKAATNAHVELLLLRQEGDIWECLVGNAKVVKEDTLISFGDGRLKAKCVKVKESGLRDFLMIYDGIFYDVLDSLAEVPLPPYITTKLEDKERYQTVYAKVMGSSAAPTAGLHFTDEVFAKLAAKKVKIVDITLHVGLGTFRPINEHNILDHKMHEEYYMMDEESADILNQAKANKQRIISIGTTSTRTLETIIKKYGHFKACSGMTDIYIYPGYQFEAIDALVTNFHLPESTLILLVSALAGKELILKAYQHAIEERYRFFSFGDAMFIY